jgi:uncharacterized protein (DUF2062 family)
MSVSPSLRRRRFWHRWLIDPIRQQLTQGVSPEKIALTLALGSALALFPILGTTTLLCLAAGIALSLNQPILQAINALCGFIWIPLLVAFVRLGDVLTRNPSSDVNFPQMAVLFRHHPWEFFQRFGVTALHGIIGWCVAAPLWIPLVYFAARIPLRAAALELRRRQAAQAGPA